MEFDRGEAVPASHVLERELSGLREQREQLGGVNLRGRGRGGRGRHPAGRPGQGARGPRSRPSPAPGHRQSEPGGPGTASRRLRGRQRDFGELFTTLFGGGKAELQLIESEDPLEAGLEILAHPPGKRPNALSLLSGGEQTLDRAVPDIRRVPHQSLADLRAGRSRCPARRSQCRAVLQPARCHAPATETRFLIITHHPLTMARMHRLFGVTMMERGVSQLVSVDLETAEQLVAEAS